MPLLTTPRPTILGRASCQQSDELVKAHNPTLNLPKIEQKFGSKIIVYLQNLYEFSSITYLWIYSIKVISIDIKQINKNLLNIKDNAITFHVNYPTISNVPVFSFYVYITFGPYYELKLFYSHWNYRTDTFESIIVHAHKKKIIYE